MDLQAAPKIDWISVWKALSILLTGAFGVLGSLTDFRDKATNKITRWGRISLVGIVLSALVGAGFQFKESLEDAAKARDDAGRALSLAQSTQSTLTNVRRLLTPIEDPTVYLGFMVPCDNSVYSQFCSRPVDPSAGEFGLWDLWPIAKHQINVPVFVNIFANGRDAQVYADEWRKGTVQTTADISFQIFAQNHGQFENLSALPAISPPGHGPHVEVGFEAKIWPLSSYRSSGSLVSNSDLNGAVVVVAIPNEDFEKLHLKLTDMGLLSLKGQRATVASPINHSAYKFTVGTFTQSGTIDTFSLKLTNQLF
jgi:hypothetical protein